MSDTTATISGRVTRRWAGSGHGARRGFTLLEILIAMGIFAFAMAGIAAMFPIAIRMQQSTSDQIMSQEIEASIRALMTADPYPVLGADDLNQWAQNNTPPP